LEIVGHQPLVVLDCAHNVASAQAVVDTLGETFPPSRRLLLFAASNDKDIAGMFRVLTGHFSAAYLTRFTNNPRAMPPGQLAELWKKAGGENGQSINSPIEAWREAKAAATPQDIICITGSVFLAGELRPVIVGQTP
ncbi:MAG: glutamate ligase domain-containing protein, partial [Candidatus Acidiferrum sp.]